MGNVTTLLDTTGGDTGTPVNLKNRELAGGKGAYISVEIGAGDTVVLEGKLHSDDSYVVLATFTTDDLIQIDLPTIFRGRRTVDGGSADTIMRYQTMDITGVV